MASKRNGRFTGSSRTSVGDTSSIGTNAYRTAR
jgi:hypothetical protein